MRPSPPPSRREVLAGGAAALAGAALGAAACGSREASAPRRAAEAGAASAPGAARTPPDAAAAATAATTADGVLRRAIPSTGELVPAIGLGSWQTFDVAPEDVPAVQPVLARFLALGGRVVDSSPMYGRAEAAIGEMLAALRAADAATPAPLLATKVWTRGARAGERQMRASMDLLGVSTLDLMQVHNLLDWKTHLPTMRAWRDEGRFRYLGVTHYQHDAFDELEQVIATERLDFVQLPYSVVDRAAEARLLPAAADHGVAVLVMQPFDSGALFDRVRGKALPDFAAELDCTSWAQLALKFLLGHPAVTCPIPATSKVKHVEDNLGALRGRVPDDDLRERIARAVG